MDTFEMVEKIREKLDTLTVMSDAAYKEGTNGHHPDDWSRASAYGRAKGLQIAADMLRSMLKEVS